jgi:ABC-type amino acid transport substrate-binding protein
MSLHSSRRARRASSRAVASSAVASSFAPVTLAVTLAVLGLAGCANLARDEAPAPVVPIVAPAPAPRTDAPERVAQAPVDPGADERGVAGSAAPRKEAPLFRVCADPSNLPYSDDRARGFENAIAEVVAEELGATLEYAWLPRVEGWLARTLGAGHCDVVMGVPTAFEGLLVTAPYYRSTYVFVQKRGARPVRSLDDPALRKMKIAIQKAGTARAASPVERALADRGHKTNVVPFAIEAEPPAADRAVQAVAAGKVDLAFLWGPQGGFFARTVAQPLRVTPAAPAPANGNGKSNGKINGKANGRNGNGNGKGDGAFEYAIGIGVAPGETALRDALDAALTRRRADIDRILAAYGVPRTDRAPQ